MKVALKGLANRVLADDTGFATVRVMSGPARGQYLSLDLRREASYWLGTYDRSKIRHVLRYCRKGMTAYDCGAYLGYYTAVFAAAVGARGRVVVLEPDPNNFRRIALHATLNNWDRATILPVALGVEHSRVQFVLAVDSAQSHIRGSVVGRTPTAFSVPERRDHEVEVECVSLDELVFERGYPAPDVIKLDLEGAEVDALRSCPRVASEVRPVFLAELHSPVAETVAADFVRRYDYVAADMRLPGPTTLLLLPRPQAAMASGTPV